MFGCDDCVRVQFIQCILMVARLHAHMVHVAQNSIHTLGTQAHHSMHEVDEIFFCGLANHLSGQMMRRRSDIYGRLIRIKRQLTKREYKRT